MLEYLKRKIEKTEPVTVVYLGGSITEGCGASHPGMRWASRIQEWMEQTFPQCQWSSYNAGIGGTNSEFGVFRLERDVLSKNPDLVFVEFAVNDYKTESDQCVNAMEEIVRRIMEQQPDAEIIFVITSTYCMYEECYQKGGRPESVMLHDRIARRYQIPSIHVGERLFERILEEKVDVSDYLPDFVHPNDRGYACYYETIRNFLDQELTRTVEYEEAVEPGKTRESENLGKTKAAGEVKAGRSLPERKGDGRYNRAHMLPAVEQAEGDFRTEWFSPCGRYDSYISSDMPGTMARLTFTGTGIGVFWMIAGDSGMIEYRIDQSDWKRASSWDCYALQFDRCNHRMLAKGLVDGEHTLEIRVSEEKDPESRGRFIRIAAFLVM